MTVILAGLVLGGLGGLLRGGRPANLRGTPIRSSWLLILGAAAQLAVTRSGMTGGPALGVVIASYLVLGTFALRNLNLTGMGVVTLGILLNLTPIVLDGGMPVESGAIVRAGIASPDEVRSLEFGAKRHLAHPGDHARALDDAVPEWFTHEVLSLGDLVISAGVAAVLADLLGPDPLRRPPRSGRRRHSRRGARLSGSRGRAAASPAAGPDRRATD